MVGTCFKLRATNICGLYSSFTRPSPVYQSLGVVDERISLIVSVVEQPTTGSIRNAMTIMCRDTDFKKTIAFMKNPFLFFVLEAVIFLRFIVEV